MLCGLGLGVGGYINSGVLSLVGESGLGRPCDSGYFIAVVNSRENRSG